MYHQAADISGEPFQQHFIEQHKKCVAHMHANVSSVAV